MQNVRDPESKNQRFFIKIEPLYHLLPSLPANWEPININTLQLGAIIRPLHSRVASFSLFGVKKPPNLVFFKIGWSRNF